MTTNIDVKPSDDGEYVVLTITKPPENRGASANIPAHEIGYFVMGLLGVSTECAKKTGKFARLKLQETEQKKLRYARATAVAIADAIAAKGEVVLVFAVGATELSVSIHKDALRDLGSAILTLSADSKTSH